MNKTTAVLYVPSDTPEAMSMATKKVAGIALIVRHAMTLYQSGINEITLLIAKSQHAQIKHTFNRYNDNIPKINYIHYTDPYAIDENVINELLLQVNDYFFLINSNLIYDASVATQLIQDSQISTDMIVCREGVHPIPFYRISKKLTHRLLAFVKTKPRAIEACLHFLLDKSDPVPIDKPAKCSTFLLTHHSQRIVAEKALQETIRHATGGPVAKYINKRISLPISLILSKLWISPNAITVFNILIGIFSGVFVADGHNYSIILLGAILFQTASIIDGCDGEVAKLTFRGSKFGQYIDTVSDNLSLASFLVGLIAGYWRHTHSYIAFVLGSIVAISVSIIFFWMVRFLKKLGTSASLVTYEKEFIDKLTGYPEYVMIFLKYSKYLIKKDVFSFLFLVLAVFNLLYFWLYITAFATTVAAIILTYLSIVEEHNSQLSSIKD